MWTRNHESRFVDRIPQQPGPLDEIEFHGLLPVSPGLSGCGRRFSTRRKMRYQADPKECQNLGGGEQKAVLPRQVHGACAFNCPR